MVAPTTGGYGGCGSGFPARTASPAHPDRVARVERRIPKDTIMRNLLLVLGLLALAVGVLWIGQGTGVIAWPRTSFMINPIEWAGYGAALAAVGLILIWQSKR
jgi:uncharacterized membrane protein